MGFMAAIFGAFVLWSGLYEGIPPEPAWRPIAAVAVGGLLIIAGLAAETAETIAKRRANGD